MNQRPDILQNIIFLIVLSVSFLSCDLGIKQYTVTFNANGGSGTPPAPISLQEFEWIDSLPGAGNLKYDGRHFSGWNSSPDGTGKSYSQGAPYQVRANITLYAQWALFSAPTNLNYSFGDGIILTWDAVEGYENLENWQDLYLYDGKTFVAYIVFRSYQPTTGSIYSPSDGFVPHAIVSSPNFRDTRFDSLSGGDFEYFVTLGVVTTRIGADGGFDVSIGPHSNIVSPVLYGDGDILPAPTGVRAVAFSPAGIHISWNAVPRATGYFLYTSLDGINFDREYGRINETETIYTWVANPGTTHYFKVAAVNGLYEAGTLSTIVWDRTPGPPKTVTGVTAVATSATSIDIAWNASDGATAYGVYYEIGSSTTKNLADTIVGQTYAHTGLTANTDYRYSIRAIDNRTSYIFESPGFSDYALCRTPASSTSAEPPVLILINDSSYPLRSIQINNGSNVLSSNLYKTTGCQVKLNPGTYTVSVYDTEDKYMSFPITIEDNVVRHSITDTWPSFAILLRNNYPFAVARAYSRKAYTISWGANLITSPITTNNTKELGVFEQFPYEVLAESLEYYRVTSGTSDNGITVSGGVLDGYKTVYYKVPEFTFSGDTTVILPATGWVRILPD